ncbi:MAG: PRD domain-containing protein [Clostridiales bacterium]|jgi:mannitol operon transcriptional antiterminator|nr:PRD domain-containing protein [Clostridiales bacterium]
MLSALVDSATPVSVNELGERLGVSRRTVFRELESADSALRRFGLRLGSVSGKGISLEGDSSGFSRLRKELGKQGAEPSSRQERWSRLALALALSGVPQKLFYYADILKVSDATISNDMDRLEPWLEEYGLALTRRQSFGVLLEGKEIRMRRAIMSVLRQSSGYRLVWDSLSPDLTVEDFAPCAKAAREICSWATPESLDSLERYLLVTSRRIMDEHELEDETPGGEFRGMAVQIANVVANHLPIEFSRGELAALSLELSACRNNMLSRASGCEESLLKLSHQLIEAFDPVTAPALKLDEDLLQGLGAHLKSALIRLKNKVELFDPLYDQIAEGYPGLMEKTAKAARLLSKDGWLPESEVSFLATHFGGALHRLEMRGAQRRRARIGIVCVNGIGTSHLLAAQVRKHIPEAAVDVIGWESQPQRLDLIISSVPLESPSAPCFIAPPFLSDEFIVKIRSELSRITLSSSEPARAAGGESTLSRIEKLKNVATDIQGLLKKFCAISIPRNVTYKELAEMVGRMLGEGEKGAELICEGLLERERIASQAVPELGIALLHCQNDGVSAPVFAVIRPESGNFTMKGYEGICEAIALLTPKGSNSDRLELMGAISAAIVEKDAFLEALRDGDGDSILKCLDEILAGHMQGFINRHWKD